MCLLLCNPTIASAESDAFHTLWNAVKTPPTENAEPSYVRNWRSVQARFVAEGKELPLPLRVFVQAVEGFTPREQLDAIQRFVLSLYTNYQSDSSTYGVKEYWATPKEVLEHGGAGDCEDFTFISFLLLSELWGNGNFALITVVTEKGERHAALVAYLDGEVLLVDGRLSKTRAIPLKEAAYSPLYGMETTNWWSYIAGR